MPLPCDLTYFPRSNIFRRTRRQALELKRLSSPIHPFQMAGFASTKNRKPFYWDRLYAAPSIVSNEIHTNTPSAGTYRITMAKPPQTHLWGSLCEVMSYVVCVEGELCGVFRLAPPYKHSGALLLWQFQPAKRL